MRVLIADDEPAHSFVLEMFLKKWGYDVVSVNNGLDALRLLQSQDQPCIAILDWNMPGMEGVDITREIKLRLRKSNIFVLMLTAKAQATDRAAALEAGVDLFMAKPFDPEELRKDLSAACHSLQNGVHFSP
jgi:DNA-binding response OmpR family regulator